MLEINVQPRGSGKTTKAIKMLREDENAVALVPSEILARIAYPFDLKDRVFSARRGTDSVLGIIYGKRVSTLIIDELMLSKFNIADLFYTLGRNGIDVIVFGTDENGYWYKRINQKQTDEDVTKWSWKIGEKLYEEQNIG